LADLGFCPGERAGGLVIALDGGIDVVPELGGSVEDCASTIPAFARRPWYAGKKNQTRRNRFLGEIECRVRGWTALSERQARPTADLSGADAADLIPAGTGWPTRRWRTRCTTARPCAAFAGIDLVAVEAAPDATTLL
jgi:hypothetical protein